MPPRPRRGANAVEFALTMPLLVAILMGIVDYSWYFLQASAMDSAVRIGARYGSVQDSGDAEFNAVATIRTELNAAGIDGSGATVTCPINSLGSLSPQLHVDCSASIAFSPLVGFVPTPSMLSAALAIRLGDQ